MLSQKLVCGLPLETVRTGWQEQRTVLDPWVGDAGRAEISGENVILAQPAGLLVLKDSS